MMGRISYAQARKNPNCIYLGYGSDQLAAAGDGFTGWAFYSPQDDDAVFPTTYFGAEPRYIYFISRNDPNRDKYLAASGQHPADAPQGYVITAVWVDECEDQHIEVEPGALDHIPLKDIVRFMRAHDLYLDARAGFTIRRNQ